jgi:hypothetical protein
VCNIPGEHALLEKVCIPLTVSTAGRVPPQRFLEIAALLRLIRDYVAASSDPAVAALLLEEGGSSLQQIQVRVSDPGVTCSTLILPHSPLPAAPCALSALAPCNTKPWDARLSRPVRILPPCVDGLSAVPRSESWRLLLTAICLTLRIDL